MTTNNKQAKRRLKQLGAALDPSKAGWSDSEDEDLVREGMEANAQLGISSLVNSLTLKLLLYSWHKVCSHRRRCYASYSC